MNTRNSTIKTVYDVYTKKSTKISDKKDQIKATEVLIKKQKEAEIHKRQVEGKEKRKKLSEPLPTPLPSISHHLKMSVRLSNGSVTSLTIKKNIIALWLLFTYNPEEFLDMLNFTIQENLILYKRLNKRVMEFVYECLKEWKKETGKGLSTFITESMIKELLEEEDYITFKELQKNLK